MHIIIILIFTLLNVFCNHAQEAEKYTLLQNKPAEMGTSVIFTVVPSIAGEDPIIAWDFGDESGLSAPVKGRSMAHTYKKPGVYYVFARIQGSDIPLNTVQTITGPLPKAVASHSSTISLDYERRKLWAVNPDNNSVALIDATTFQLISEVPVGKNPRTVSVDGSGNAWVTNQDDATISIVSESGKNIQSIRLPYASRPYGICFDPSKKYAYVSLQGIGKVMQLDGTKKTELQMAWVGNTPRGLAVTSDGKKVLVTQFISPVDIAIVREIDSQTMMVSNTIELAFDLQDDFEDRGRGVPNFLSSVTISPDGTQAWVPSKKDNTARGIFRDGQTLTFDNTVRTIVSKIDLLAGEENISQRIDINDADMACAVEFSPYGNIAFVALQGNNKVVMIDVEYHSRLGSLDSTGLAPQGLALSPDGTRLFVQNFMSRTISVYDTEDIILSNNQIGTLLATIPSIQKELLPPQLLKGKQIFYNAQDERMTFAGYISCASCHLEGASDERVWDFTDRGEGLRNTHSLLGKSGTRMGNIHWTSNFDEIQDFENDIRTGFGGKGFLPDSIFYSGTFSDPLGSKKAGLSRELDALAAYINSLDKVHPSPFRNPNGTLTNDALEGKIIFIRAGCADCHSGPDFTDRSTGLFHDVGTIRPSSGKRRGEALPGFGTPTLKGLWETAPYLHDGSAPTLKDVLLTRNLNKKHGDLTSFSESELDQLVAYLLQIDEEEYKTTGLSYPYFWQPDLLSIAPNPSSDLVKLNWKDLKPNVKITIYNSEGIPLFTKQVMGLNETVFDVRNCLPGMYFVDYFDGINKCSVKIMVK